MKPIHIVAAIFLVAFLGFVTGLSVMKAPSREGAPQQVTQETRWEKVKRTGVLRCGYITYPPYEFKDPATGQMGGFFYDLVEEIGKQLNIKIEWSGEVAPAQIMSDVNLGHYDMICAPFFVTPGRAREGNFTIPVLYHPNYLYVRIDDPRFDNDYTKANDTGVTFSIQDGDFSAISAHEFFPKAATAAIPQISSASELFVQVASKKADVLVGEPLSFSLYNKENPGKLRQAKGGAFIVGAVAMPLAAREYDFKSVIDNTLTYLLGMGIVDKLLSKYETPELKFMHIAKPYSDNGTAP